MIIPRGRVPLSLISRRFSLLLLHHFVGNLFGHCEDLLPAGIVGEHLGGEIVAQLFEFLAERKRIVFDVGKAPALLFDQGFLLSIKGIAACCEAEISLLSGASKGFSQRRGHRKDYVGSDSSLSKRSSASRKSRFSLVGNRLNPIQAL